MEKVEWKKSINRKWKINLLVSFRNQVKYIALLAPRAQFQPQTTVKGTVVQCSQPIETS